MQLILAKCILSLSYVRFAGGAWSKLQMKVSDTGLPKDVFVGAHRIDG